MDTIIKKLEQKIISKCMSCPFWYHEPKRVIDKCEYCGSSKVLNMVRFNDVIKALGDNSEKIQ